MPALTRTACRTRARFQLNEPSERFYTDSAMNDWCDDAVRDVSLRSLCYQVKGTAISTSSGVYTYAYPTTLNTSAIETIEIKTIINSSNVALGYITPDLIGKAGEDQSELKWSRWGRYIWITPTPQTAYALTPLFWAESRQTAAGNLNLPNIYHHLVPMYMVYKGHEAKRNYTLATKVFQEYEDEIARIVQVIHPTDIPAANIKPGTPVQTVQT